MKILHKLFIGLMITFLVIAAGLVLADNPPPPPGGGNIFVLRFFLQGFYAGDETMRKAQWFDGEELRDRFAADYVEQYILQLHTPGHYGETEGENRFYAITAFVNEAGFSVVNLPTEGSYYLAIKTRNHLETVTAVPVNLASNSSYDFTTSAEQGYGANLVKLGAGAFGLYAGDVNQDGYIDGLDLTPIILELRSHTKGYVAEDITGDGYLDGHDLTLVVLNLRKGIERSTPAYSKSCR